jgi:hypothetical protein
MKAKTIALTKICSYCKTAVTFKSKETLEKHLQTHNGFYHSICLKAIKKGNK